MRQQKINISIKIIFLVCAALFYSCGSSKKPVATESSASGEINMSDNMIWDMDVTITNEGQIRAKFRGGYVERDNIGNSKYSVSRIDSGLVIEFYEKEKNTGMLKSERGTINDLSEVFTAIDSVVFKSTKGYILYTDTLIWNRKLTQIYTDCEIMMIKDNRDTLYGEGFITDEKFNSYEIKKPRGMTVIEGKNQLN